MDDSSGPIHWHHFLTGKDDRTLYNVSFLSRPAEWHAAAMGVISAVFPQVAILIACYIGGRQFGKTSGRPPLDTLPQQLQDAVREPVYWGGGALLARAVMVLVYGVPFLPSEVLSIL